LEDFLPGIVNQLGTFSPPKTSAMVANTREGPENLANLQRMAEQYQSNQAWCDHSTTRKCHEGMNLSFSLAKPLRIVGDDRPL
jgi:hypothetical protein